MQTLSAQRVASQALFLAMHAAIKRRAAAQPADPRTEAQILADIAKTIGG